MLKNVNAIRILPRWIIILIDLGIILFSVILSYLLRFNFDLAAIAERNFFIEVGVYLLFNFLAIIVIKSYSGIIRFTGIQDAIRVAYTVLIAIIGILIFNVLYEYRFDIRLIPLSVIIIGYFISVFFLITYRLLVKSIFSYFRSAVKRQKKVAIFGAGKLGQITKQIIESDADSNLKIIAFLEDDKRKAGKVIDGIPIYSTSEIYRIFKDGGGNNELIIAIKDVTLSRKNEIVELCLKNNIKIRQVPSAETWVKGELSLNQIREVKIEDLLGRESIKLNNIKVGHDLNDRVVCITGAAGSIGSEIARQICEYAPTCILLLDQSETGLFEIERELNKMVHNLRIEALVADITHRPRMEAIFKKYHPDIIYHAAAYKHVPMMERNPVEAVLCNVYGTKIVADLAHEYHVDKFVMISTDKAVNPTNVMGASKRIAEMYVQSLNNFKVADKHNYTRYVTTRFGNVLGSNGSVIPLFKKQIREGGPITVTHPEITRYFMTISEACQLVLEAGAMGEGGEIFIFDMGESVKIVNLARKMIKLSGLQLDKDIEIHFTGLREGEKLYEELLNNRENTIPTHHDKIMIAKVVEEPYLKVSKDVEKLFTLAEKKDDLELVKYMKKMVPEFLSNYSPYEILDSKVRHL